MICSPLLILGGVLGLVDSPGGPATGPSYEQMKEATGRDAAAQVRLALWCEAHGLERERLKHLGVAILADPSNAMARGLMGLVEFGGRWRKPEAVAEAVKADVKRADLLAEYNGRRVKAPVAAGPQYKLALWCEEKGLRDEARAHLATVVRLDPNHVEAWKRLGYKKVGNRWISDAQAAKEKSERQAQQEADRAWRPRLTRLREALDAKGPKRAEAGRELATITDPRAVPTVWHVFVERGGDRQAEAVQLLGQIDAIEASRALASLALSAKSDEVRRRATETLKRRDPREWADRLIAMFREPIKYEVKPVGGPGSPGTLFIEGKEVNLKRVYAPPPPPIFAVGPMDSIETDALGLPVLVRHQFVTIRESVAVTPQGGVSGALDQRLPSNPTLAAWTPGMGSSGAPGAERAIHGINAAMAAENQRARDDALAGYRRSNTARLEPTRATLSQSYEQRMEIPVGRMVAQAWQTAAVAGEQLRQDVRRLEAINASVQESNGQVARVLDTATAANLPAERAPWASWYADQLGVVSKLMTSDEAPTIVESVPIAAPAPVPIVTEAVPWGAKTVTLRHSCFGRGTPVRTISGSRPIEGLEVGDLVLTQSTGAGRLGYRPIVAVFHNPPSPTFEVKLRGEAIVTSPSHRFWVAGRGWVMARELKVGDPIRTLGGMARVEAIEPGEVQPVFNLDVADDADFFAGDAAALVHDNTLPDLKQAPFDAPAAVAAK